MTPAAGNAVLWLVAIITLLVLFARQRRRRGRVGSAAAGSVYDLLNEDKRNAVEIVVEERAGARDPEDRDGNLPDLENPTGPPPSR
jgi:MYXO-CTERM domain-containing protein